MLENIVENKVKIFISSICDNARYTIIRKALKEILTNTGFVEVYIFEDAASSSFSVEESYLNELEQSDLCIFILDNADKMTEGVIKEYNRANELNKKSMYFFCDEKEKKKTELQVEIEMKGTQRYKIIHEFSNMTHEIYRAVMQDIINMYKYKNHIHEEAKIEKITDSGKTKGYKIKKIDREGLKLATNELLKEINMKEKVNEEKINEFDLLCADFIKVVLKEKKIDEMEFEFLKLKIIEMYSGNLKEVIKNRLNAVKLYYSGNIESCIKTLKNILKFQNEDVPEWIMNDVAIDLRNIENIYLQMHNKVCFENEGQKYINNSEESLYYPLLDRIEADRKNDMLKRIIDYRLDSPYTNKVESFYYIFDYISLCFYIALINGSITHLRITLQRMSETLLSLYMKYDDHDIYIQIIKFFILGQKDKEIEKLLRIYNKKVDIVNSDDINKIYELIENIEIDYYKKISECLLLKYFKYYFSEERYNKTFEKVCNDISNWIDDDNRILDYGKYYFDMLKGNIDRADNKKIVNIVIKVFKNKLMRYYDEALGILQRINYSNIDVKLQEEILKYLIDSIRDKNLCNNINELEKTIISFRKRATIKTKDNLDTIIYKEMNHGFKEIYKLEIEQQNIEYKKMYIKKCIENIHRQNEEQGKDGLYKGYSSNEYITIRNIIKYNNIILETKEINRLMNILIETLISETQTTSAKNSAIQVIIYLKEKFHKKRIWNKYREIIEKNKDKFLQGKEDMFFYEESALLIKFNLKLLYIIFNIKTENDEVELINIAMQLQDYEKIKSLEYINYFLEELDYSKVEEKLIEVMLQYINIMCNEEEIDIRFWATKCLIQLTYSPYKKIALYQLTNIMNSGSSELKITIISRLKQISLDDNDEFIEFIINKAKVDNNFLVRKIAIDFNKEGDKL